MKLSLDFSLILENCMQLSISGVSYGCHYILSVSLSMMSVTDKQIRLILAGYFPVSGYITSAFSPHLCSQQIVVYLFTLTMLVLCHLAWILLPNFACCVRFLQVLFYIFQFTSLTLWPFSDIKKHAFNVCDSEINTFLHGYFCFLLNNGMHVV